MSAILAAFSRCATDLADRRRLFIEFCASLAAFHVSDPTQQLLPLLFQYGSLDDRVAFASHLGDCLRRMQESATQQLWDGWLCRLWRDRLDGIPAALHETEIRKMLEWLPHLGNAFPDAVRLAVRFPVIAMEHSLVIHELRKSELVTRFPLETADLLVFFAGCSVGWHASDLEAIAARLPPIPAQLRHRVDEAFARAGMIGVRN
jgi:hypothetical protein